MLDRTQTLFAQLEKEKNFEEQKPLLTQRELQIVIHEARSRGWNHIAAMIMASLGATHPNLVVSNPVSNKTMFISENELDLAIRNNKPAPTKVEAALEELKTYKNNDKQGLLTVIKKIVL